MDGMGGAGALANELIWLRTPRTGDCQVNCKREEGVLGVGGLDASGAQVHHGVPQIPSPLSSHP